MIKEKIMGVDVCVTSYKSLGLNILEDIELNKKGFIVAINPEKIIKAQEDPTLMELLNKAKYQIPDGIGVLIASRLKKGEIKERITGVDLMIYLCELASNHHKKVFLYGGKPGVADSAKEKLEEQFPNIHIVGTMNGYEKNKEKVIDEINKSQADILFVALGSPTQEKWIIEHMDKLCPKIYQGVGGSYDVISGNIKRAPKAFQNLGLEWLYRLILEPSRIKRQLNLPKFLIKVLKD